MTELLDAPMEVLPADEVEDQPAAAAGGAALEDVADVAAELTKNVLFVTVNIHRWRGLLKAEGAAVAVDGEPVAEEAVTEPRWRLLPKEWNDKFGKIETTIRTLVDRVSLPFPIRGISVVPRLKARDLFAEIDRIVEEEFNPLVDAFIAQWDDLVKAIRADHTAASFAGIQKKLPPSALAARACFRIAKHVIPVGAGIGEVYSDADATAFAGEIHAATRSFIDDTARTLADGLQAELQDAVNTLVERIDSKGVVQSANLEKVRRAMDKMESFRFLASPAVIDRLREARLLLLSVGHAELNADNRRGDRNLANGLRAALTSFMGEVNADAAAVEGLGRLRRAVDLEDDDV